MPLWHDDSGTAVSSNEHIDQHSRDHLQDSVLDSTDVEAFLSELCQDAVKALSKGKDVLCGVTLLRERNVATAASSAERVRDLDELQYSFDDGPCLDAARKQTVIHAPDLLQEERWQAYVGATAGQGIRSILAVPFDLAGEDRAVLNLYSEDAHAFTAEAVDRAVAYANEASRSLRLVMRVAQRGSAFIDVQAALQSRTTIDVAVGIIMCRSSCSQVDAFEFLKNASSHRNIKLRELAGQIVATSGTSSTHAGN